MNGISNGAAILHFTSYDVNCNSFPKVPKVKWLPQVEKHLKREIRDIYIQV